MPSDALNILNKIYELGELSDKIKLDDIPKSLYVGKYEIDLNVTILYDDDVDLN